MQFKVLNFPWNRIGYLSMNYFFIKKSMNLAKKNLQVIKISVIIGL